MLFVNLSNGFLNNKFCKVLYIISPLFPVILLVFSNIFAIICLKSLINIFLNFPFASFSFLLFIYFLYSSCIFFAELLFLIIKALWSQSLKRTDNLILFLFSLLSWIFFNNIFFFFIFCKLSFAKLFLIALWILIIELIFLSSWALSFHCFNLFLNKSLFFESFFSTINFNNFIPSLLFDLFLILSNSFLFIYKSNFSNPSFIKFFLFIYFLNFTLINLCIFLAFSWILIFSACLWNLLRLIFFR